MALRLHAIVGLDAHQSGPAVDGTTLVPFRDLAAIVTDKKQFASDESAVDPGELESHREVVDALFHGGAVLPAPPGVLFRAPDVLLRWMELHYVALSDAPAHDVLP